MAWDETWRLTLELAKDPASHVAAAVADWEYPVSREWQVTAQLFDLQHHVAAQGKRVKPYPRPWRPAGHRKLTAASPERWAQIRAELAANADEQEAVTLGAEHDR